MVFIHAHVGSMGRMNDAPILTNSGLDHILSALPEDFMILGGSDYPHKVNLMRPYKDNGHLTRRQSNLNTTLGASRSVVERAFAQLIGKFQCLKHLDMDNLNMIPMFVMAACVVHNVIFRSKQSLVLRAEELEDPGLARREPDVTRAPSAAKAKRGAIASLLHPTLT